MATTISVNKQNVLELLSTGRNKPFVIPEYQRPYAWTDEQIQTLFEDIWEFAMTVGGLKQNGSYFLGSIVSFENEDGEQEIIDGQQRITSLFLLLRAIYTKLKKGDDSNTEAAQNFINKIEPAIWRTDNLTGKVDYSDILLTSRVVDNAGNEILKKILETGVADERANDNYSKNYILFQKLYDLHCQQAPLKVFDFIYALLNQAILLPIGADNQDTALTIFSTLNNRGLPLNDADIFKAKIYNNLKNDDEKNKFIEQWKALEKDAIEAKESIQHLFYYYMFCLRAQNNDDSSTTPGVRKYYLDNKAERLYAPDLMGNLRTILNLWKVINTNQDIPGETWDNEPKIRKTLDILTSYPNEYWKYPVIMYYLKHRGESSFNEDFSAFINMLASELISRFTLFPTINYVKGDIMKLNVQIASSTKPPFTFRPLDKSLLESRITIPHRNILRMLLKVYAYNHQETLLPDNWQIEHILPQKWQPTFFENVDDTTINEKIEHIGNKTPFERKLNIIASNGYFRRKQEEYAKSSMEVSKILATAVDGDWKLSNIEHRDRIVTSDILQTLKQWEERYNDVIDEKPKPTKEEQEMIDLLKSKGLI